MNRRVLLVALVAILLLVGGVLAYRHKASQAAADCGDKPKPKDEFTMAAVRYRRRDAEGHACPGATLMAFSLRPEDAEQARSIGVMASAGWAFAISVVLGLGGGMLLDRWLGTSPWLLFVGLGLGFAAGVSNLVRDTNAASRRR